MGHGASMTSRVVEDQAPLRVVGGRYQLVARMGSGASGCVYKAIDTARDNAQVAIKTIIASDMDDDDAAEAEINMHSALNSAHSTTSAQSGCHFLTRFIDSFSEPSTFGNYGATSADDDTYGSYGSYPSSASSCSSAIDEVCIVTEFCNGGALSDVAKYSRACAGTAQRVTEKEMAALCASMVMGLCYMHKHGAIHRDVKSDNVLLTTEGQCKLVDFGISAFISNDATNPKQQRSTLCGTPAFMAPEVITASSTRMGMDEESDSDSDDDDDIYADAFCPSPSPAASPSRTRSRTKQQCSLRKQEQEAGYTTKADVWSIGITAIEIADGVTPAARSGNRSCNPYFMMSNIAQQPAPELAAANRENWSPEFHDFLRCCLQKNPRHRASAAALATHPFVAEACADLKANSGKSPQIAELVQRVADWKRTEQMAEAQRREQRRQQRRRRRSSSSSSCSGDFSSSSDSLSWNVPVAADGKTVLLPGKQTRPHESADATFVVLTKKHPLQESPTSVVAPLQLLQSLKFQPMHNL